MMSGIFKILSDEVAANTTPSQFASQRVIRLANKGTAARTVTLFESPISVDLTINASANGTTLLTIANGASTTGVTVGDRIISSSNTGVVNTYVPSVVSSVNSTAIVANVDIVIANGDCTVWTSPTNKTFTMIPNSEFIIEKGRTEFLQSNNDADIVAIAVSYRG